MCVRVHTSHSLVGMSPSLNPQVGKISFRREKEIWEEEKGKKKSFERRKGGREIGFQQWKSTADSSNPRSLSQLGMIVMESLRQNLKGKPLQQQALLLYQLFKRLLYTMHLPLCVLGVDNREIWP